MNWVNFVQTISCYLFNARSITNKLVDLEHELLLLILLPSIIFVTETWLDSDCFISGYLSTKYQIFRRDRNGHGGGVMILIDNSFASGETACNIFSNEIEAVWCTCELGGESFLFGVAYRPPNCTHEYSEKLFSQINEMCDSFSSHNIFICNDFNLPNINWNIPCLVNGDKTSESFLNCVIDNGLSQIVCCNARNENILDLVLCNAFDNISVADIVPPLVSSDHDC